MRAVETWVGCKVRKPRLYILAFTHASLGGDKTANNERLEFLGDSLLGSIVSRWLYQKYPNKGEGYLTQMRSRIVKRQKLNAIGRKMGFGEFIRARKGQDLKSNALGNAFEALVGALYMEFGYRKCERILIKQILAVHIDLESLEEEDLNYKSLLVEWAQGNAKRLDFVILDTDESGKKPIFTAGVRVDGKIVAKAKGGKKKIAETAAAKIFYEELGL